MFADHSQQLSINDTTKIVYPPHLQETIITKDSNYSEIENTSLQRQIPLIFQSTFARAREEETEEEQGEQETTGINQTAAATRPWALLDLMEDCEDKTDEHEFVSRFNDGAKRSHESVIDLRSSQKLNSNEHEGGSLSTSTMHIPKKPRVLSEFCHRIDTFETNKREVANISANQRDGRKDGSFESIKVRRGLEGPIDEKLEETDIRKVGQSSTNRRYQHEHSTTGGDNGSIIKRGKEPKLAAEEDDEESQQTATEDCLIRDFLRRIKEEEQESAFIEKHDETTPHTARSCFSFSPVPRIGRSTNFPGSSLLGMDATSGMQASQDLFAPFVSQTNSDLSQQQQQQLLLNAMQRHSERLRRSQNSRGFHSSNTGLGKGGGQKDFHLDCSSPLAAIRQQNQQNVLGMLQAPLNASAHAHQARSSNTNSLTFDIRNITMETQPVLNQFLPGGNLSMQSQFLPVTSATVGTPQQQPFGAVDSCVAGALTKESTDSPWNPIPISQERGPQDPMQCNPISLQSALPAVLVSNAGAPSLGGNTFDHSNPVMSDLWRPKLPTSNPHHATSTTAQEGDRCSDGRSKQPLLPYDQRQANIVPLSIDEDPNWLTEFLCFVRSDLIEVVRATRHDVESRMTTTKHITEGQVGIRCRFCAHLAKKAVRSSCFPSSIRGLYQSVTMMIREHFSSSPEATNGCQAMPREVKVRYHTLKSKTTQGATDSKRYWVEAAKKMGMVDTDKNYITMSESTIEAAIAAEQLRIQRYIITRPMSVSFTSGCDKGLLKGAPSAKYIWFLLSQMDVVALTEEECLGNRRNMRPGWPGFGCRCCSALARMGTSRFFPVKRRALTGKLLIDFPNHLLKCTAFPEHSLIQLRVLREEAESKLSNPNDLVNIDRDGERQLFFDQVWNQLHRPRLDACKRSKK